MRDVITIRISRRAIIIFFVGVLILFVLSIVLVLGGSGHGDTGTGPILHKHK